MIFPNKTTFTSDAITVANFQRDAVLTITGPGPVAVEMLQEDGVWRSFPETTFTGPAAKVLTLPAGSIRIAIAAATATTVGLNF